MHRRAAQNFQQMNNLSARGNMISSQLRNQHTSGVNWDDCHDSFSDLVDDIPRRLLRRIRRAGLAVAQASRALSDVRALSRPTADEEALRRQAAGQHHVRPCSPSILGYQRQLAGQCYGATEADLTIRASIVKAAGMIVKNGMAVARNLLEIQRVKAFCGEQP